MTRNSLIVQLNCSLDFRIYIYIYIYTAFLYILSSLHTTMNRRNKITHQQTSEPQPSSPKLSPFRNPKTPPKTKAHMQFSPNLSLKPN